MMMGAGVFNLHNALFILPHILCVSAYIPTAFSDNPKMIFNYEPLSAVQLSNLAHHKYKSCGKSVIEPYFEPMWTFCAHLVPMSVAPNLLTVLGLLFNILGTGLLLYYSPMFVSEVGVRIHSLPLTPTLTVPFRSLQRRICFSYSVCSSIKRWIVSTGFTPDEQTRALRWANCSTTGVTPYQSVSNTSSR